MNQLAAAPSHLPTVPETPRCVQPGGGFCFGLEMAWGRWRRWFLRTVRPGYVRRMAEKRKGTCEGCTHDIVDPRDLKFQRNVCGYWFDPEDDAFAWRGRLGFARHGLAELLVFSLLLWLVGGVFGSLAAWLHPLFAIGSVAALVVWLEVVWFFRDPERIVPSDPDALISPADGVVTHVEEVADPDFPNGRALRISIFLSIFNVHVNRIPWTGKVTQVRYFPGAFLDARNFESAVRNEQLWIDMVDPRGMPMRCKQISGAIARRIVCWLKAGDEVMRGERLGMIKFGSRTDLLLPTDAAREVCVKVGDVVKGAKTILMRMAAR
jgi:phosphatidylserine decarboxylase